MRYFVQLISDTVCPFTLVCLGMLRIANPLPYQMQSAIIIQEPLHLVLGQYILEDMGVSGATVTFMSFRYFSSILLLFHQPVLT